VANTPREVLEDYGQKFVDAFRESLLKNEKFVSGNLSQSILAMPVKIMGQNLVMEIRASEYFDYVNDGVNGTQRNNGSPYSFRKKNVNQSAMLKHIANRGINYKDMQNFYRNSKGLKVKRKKPLDKDKALKTLAFLIGRKVSKKGIKPTHFADEVIESNLKKQMEIELSKSMGRMINIEIKKAIDGNNK
jgi:hypothetical protein